MTSETDWDNPPSIGCMVYEELLAMAREGDPLVGPDRQNSASITPEGLLIRGSVESGYQADMLIREGTSEEDVFHGRTWTAEYLAPDFEALRTWAYSW